jgi:hypothetical protein
MTAQEITEARQRAAVKFDAAAKIRTVLDEARAAYGAEAWDNEDLESETLALVTEEASS